MVRNRGRRRLGFELGTASLALCSGIAHAQTQATPQGDTEEAQPLQSQASSERPGYQVVTDPPAEDDGESGEIVVTGTLIRGIAPVGSNVIGIGEQQVEASGATTTNQVLQTLPQLGNYFNQLPVGPPRSRAATIASQSSGRTCAVCPAP